MIDPRFFNFIGKQSIAQVIAAIEEPATASLENALIEISGIAPLSSATEHEIAYFGAKGNQDDLKGSSAGAIFITEKDSETLTNSGQPDCPVPIVCANPPRAFSQAVGFLFPTRKLPDYAGFSLINGAHIHNSVRLEENVVIAPGAVIEENVEIGQNTQIGANTTLHHGVKIGRDSTILSNVTLQCALLGDHVLIHPGARIGQEGFGFLATGGPVTKIPQMGRVIIQNHVEIGANTTVDRGTLSDTTIGEGAKIDDLVMIAHNCQIGRHTILCGNVGLSGSTTIGDYAVLGGRVLCAGHLRIGKGAMISGNSMITKDVADGAYMGGSPAKPIGIWRREQATLSRLTKNARKSDN